MPDGQMTKKKLFALDEESPFSMDSLFPGQITMKLDSLYRLSVGIS